MRRILSYRTRDLSLGMRACHRLVVSPFIGGGPMSSCPGWSFFWPRGSPVAFVVRLRWPRPVAGLGGVVSWCPTGGSCGCRPWSRLAGDLPAFVGCFFGVAGLWLLLLPSCAPSGWRVCPSGAGRAPHMACSGRFLPVRAWGSPPPFVLCWVRGLASSSLRPPLAGACTGR